MNKNLEIINNWNKSISSYKKLSIKEAKELYNENKTKDVINGTLYVVLNYIKSSGLMYLNSTVYSMDDVISVSCEIWVEKINSGRLLEVENFFRLFDGEFYNKLCDSLGIIKYSIIDDISMTTDIFIDLLNDYVKLQEKYGDVDYNKFIEHISNERKYRYTIRYIKKMLTKRDYFSIFEAIINSFELGNEDVKISRTRLKSLRYLLLNNGFEYLREDINKFYTTEQFDNYIKEYVNDKIDSIILEGDLTDREKKVIEERFGLTDSRPKTLEEVGLMLGSSAERIRQIEAKALRKLRHPLRSRKLKELM